MTEMPNQEKAHDEHFLLDNRLMLEWYPRRVVDQASGPSMLELGLGFGFTTSFLKVGVNYPELCNAILLKLHSDEID